MLAQIQDFPSLIFNAWTNRTFPCRKVNVQGEYKVIKVLENMFPAVDEQQLFDRLIMYRFFIKNGHLLNGEYQRLTMS